MRLFVGVEIDPAVAARLSDLRAELQRRAAARSPRARITWVPAERLHLTVRFIGEVDDGLAEGIRRALAPPLQMEPFAIAIGGAGAFPPSGPPRVLWAGVASGGDALARVEREVSDRLAAACDVQREERPFRPHLTLARVHDAAGLRAQPLLDGLREGTLGATRVDAITLFQSRLSPHGATYLPLQRTALESG